jgi:putative oxidoreductase
MFDNLKNNPDIASLLMRLAVGGMMLTHGYPKLMNLFGGGEIKFPNPIGVGAMPSLALTVFAEFVCALMILIGFRTKLATIPLAVTMLVAIVAIHWADPFGDKELAAFYLLGCAAIFFLGSGKYSLDAVLGRNQA